MNYLLRVSIPSACILVLLVCPLASQADMVLFDFTTDDNGHSLTHGQVISTEPDVQSGDTLFEFGKIAKVRTTQGSSGHLGAVIFDSTPDGPAKDKGDPDRDLLVDMGNILTIQDPQRSKTTNTGADANGLVFNAPDDVIDPNAGSIIFEFVEPIAPLAVDIIDADLRFAMKVIMTDVADKTRTFIIPELWTFDIAHPLTPMGAKGYSTLVLADATPQDGEGPGSDLTPGTADDLLEVIDTGLDPTKVVSLEFQFLGATNSSGAIDNLLLDGVRRQNIPEPTSYLMAILACVAVGWARRRA